MIKTNNYHFLLFVFLITIFSCCFTTLSNYVHTPIDGFKDLTLTVLHFLIVTIGCFAFYYFLALNKYVFTLFFPLISSVSATIAYFVFFQNVTFTTSILDAALHNDIRTSLDLITLSLVLFVGSSITISVFAVFYRFKKIVYRFRWIEFIAVFLIGTFIYQINIYRNNSIFQRLPFSIYFVAKIYSQQIQNVSRSRSEFALDAYCQSDTVTLVLIIGESARADHFQLNGYKRATTPMLSKTTSISYPNIYSEWTHTNPSLAHFLTRSDSLNHEPSLTEQSFISIFNRCGYATTWIANQEPAPNYMPLVKEAQNVTYVNPGFSVYNYNKKWLDLDALSHLEQSLKVNAPRKLIIIHTIGSHWWYNDHFTDSTTIFKPILETKNIIYASQSELINSYDNTIVSTDYFLSKIINHLEGLNACMVYLSDHGESLGENGKWLHAQDNEPEKNPACILWFSQKYISKHNAKYLKILANKNKKWRTDFLFHSILSVGDIKSNTLNCGVDISK